MAEIGTVVLIVGILLGVMIILVGGLLAVSPGRVKPFLDENGLALVGSIAEKIHVNINGRYQEIGNATMVKQLEAAPPTMSVPLPAAYMKVRDSAMHDLGVGTTHDMKSVMTGVFLASWLFRGYTLGEKFALWRGKFSSDKMLW